MAADDLLHQFVKEALTRGLPRSEIEEALRRAGWGPEEARAALGLFAPVECPVPVPRPRPSLSPREAFLYLLQFTTLYLAAFNLVALLFRLIDRALPDPTARMTYSPEPIRWAVSFLVVTCPVFLYVSIITHRMVRRDPSKRASEVRRWLTYLTLFVAACIVIGDVVGLLYNFLGGELTVRFVLKVLTVGAIAGGIFAYYLSDLRVEERELAA
jgi:hypothetical protein